MLVSLSVFWQLFSTEIGGEILLLCFSSLSGWSADARISLRVLWTMPVVCGKNQGIGGRKCGVLLISRGCGLDLMVGATQSEEFLTPRCGWGNRDLWIETAPGRSDVECIKLH